VAIGAVVDPNARAAARAQLESAEQLLLDFLEDQAAICTIFGDIETTELIAHGTPLSNMEISVATLLFEEGNGAESFTLSFWGDASLGRGAPLRFMRHALDHAKQLAFYHSRFDLTVIAAGDVDTVTRWEEKTFDPYAELRAAFPSGVSLKLDNLLKANDLDPKTSTGAEAVAMFKQGRYDELQAYNERDVRALRELVNLATIKLPNGALTTVGTMPRDESPTTPTPPRSGGADFPTFPPDSPQRLQQNSPAWHTFRRGKIGASTAAALLRLSPHTARDDAFEDLVDPPDAPPDETPAMRRGHAMEARIANRYVAVTGSSLAEVGSFVHSKREWLFASPDRLVHTPDMAPGRFALLECKSTQRAASPPPPHFVIQCMVQLACAPAAPYVDLAQMDLQGAFVVHRIRPDKELFDVVLARLGDVWASAERVFQGSVPAEDAFAYDFREFDRTDLRELKQLLVDVQQTSVKRIV
jgi:putative phage-type endonuclease